VKRKAVIYHGSEKMIEAPKLGKASAKKDYGYGFYCALDKNAAYIWANRNGGAGYCNQYEMNEEGLNILNLTNLEPMYWISLLLQDRTLDETDQRKYKTLLEGLFKAYPVSLVGIDVVIGYRADDRYFRYCKDFLSSQLDYESLEKALKLGKLGTQYVPISSKAFQRIHFLNAEKIENNYLHSYAKRIEKASDDYQEVIDNVDQRNGVL